MKIYLHCAYQTCDTKSRDNPERFCGTDRSELTRKSVTSFFESLNYAVDQLQKMNIDLITNVKIFDDRSTKETLEFLETACEYYAKDNITTSLVNVKQGGILSTIRSCFNFLESEGRDLVYQIQDDFLFFEDGLYQLIEILLKVHADKKVYPYVITHNHPWYWSTEYAYQQIPMIVVPGCRQYWIQSYQLGCTFLTHKTDFSQHWDLYNKFFSMSPTDVRLELDTFIKIIRDRGRLGLQPMSTVAMHMQRESDRDPYVEWETTWHNLPDIMPKKF